MAVERDTVDRAGLRCIGSTAAHKLGGRLLALGGRSPPPPRPEAAVVFVRDVRAPGCHSRSLGRPVRLRPSEVGYLQPFDTEARRHKKLASSEARRACAPSLPSSLRDLHESFRIILNLIIANH